MLYTARCRVGSLDGTSARLTTCVGCLRSLAEITRICNSDANAADAKLTANDADNSGTLNIDEFYAMLLKLYRESPNLGREALVTYEKYCTDNASSRRRSKR
jgi:hypothetical protein